MIKEFIGTGKDIGEATASAKLGLNAPSNADVKIEVVAMPKKKVLGIFGGSDAKVKASYDDGKKEKKPQPKKTQAPKKSAPAKEAAKKAPQQKKAKPAPKAEKAIEKKPTKPQRTEEVVTLEDIDLDYAVKYLQAMIDGLCVKDAKITAKLVDGVVQMEVACDDYGIIIGRRGDTLDSLQYLTSLAIKKQSDKYVRVTLNVGNYREKRVETLRSLARKNASYVARTGKRYTFEPMNPYERRIIHTTVQEIEGVESRSIGYDMDRRVVLEPEGGVKNNGGSYQKRQGGGNRSRAPKQNNAPATNAQPKADRADLPKFGKIEVNK